MSAFRKVVIATLLVSTGLGVAFFLGQPAITPVIQSGPTRVPQSALFTAPHVAKQAADAATASVKLLPESTAAAPATGVPEPPALLSSLTAIAAIPTRSAAISDLADLPSAGPLPSPQPSPRAAYDFKPIVKLRDEAPRPIGNEPRSPATIRRMPPVNAVETAVYTPVGIAADDAYAVAKDANEHWAGAHGKNSVGWPTAQSPAPEQPLVNAVGYGKTDATTAAHLASATPAQPADIHHVSPPPWPAALDIQPARTHVIEDGDSLQKLASQYLDDPLRSEEIFALNREVLSNPDLLPIGAELKLPERVPHSSWNHQMRHVEELPEAAIRQAAFGSLVPIRRTFSHEPRVEFAPRARLSTPVAPE